MSGPDGGAVGGDEFVLDLGRHERIGFGEAIYAQGKSAAQLAAILERAHERDASFLITRLSPATLAALPPVHQDRIDYEPVSATGFFGPPAALGGEPRVAVVAAGTSDVPVAREAVRTLQFEGVRALEITDVGVAGLWRLMRRLEEIRRLPMAIVVAGMDAALPTVMGGLVRGVVIGVPTSVGYGVAADGRTALNAMLASCAPGVTVVNIDNGYGAACAALRLLNVLT